VNKPPVGDKGEKTGDEARVPREGERRKAPVFSFPPFFAPKCDRDVGERSPYPILGVLFIDALSNMLLSLIVKSNAIGRQT